MKKQSIIIRELAPLSRVNDFSEVVLGYSEAEAQEEAKRCLQCKNPSCMRGCPVGIDIKKFIYQITEKDYQQAYFTIREKNNFPSICGRVCPAEYQCRKTCVLAKKGLSFTLEETINIPFLERFIGDYGIKHGSYRPQNIGGQFKKKRVAVVGSGPAGLCCAGELARWGIKVVIFESLHKPGGVLRYGIPPFRLPRNILDFEIDYLRELGVEIVTNMVIGKSKSLDELFKDFSSIFLGLGAGVPSFLGIPGENLCNVYSANEFLTRVNLMQAFEFPRYHTPINIGKNVVVIGGGNTAIDAVRVALRLQKRKKIKLNTTIFYRRTEAEMPARRLEIEHAKQEGVNFKFLVQPIEFIGDEKGYVKKIKALNCRLGEPDASGRRRSVVIPASDFEVDCDVAIVAIGFKASRLFTSVTPHLKLDKYGNVVVNPDTMETSIKNVYAGGDIKEGEGTVIEAMKEGKIAARAIAGINGR